MPFVSRTRATFLSAEFGFFGVWVNTRTQTPRFCGLSCSAGLLVLLTIFLRPWRTSWLIVGITLREKCTGTASAIAVRLIVSGLKAGGLAPENPMTLRSNESATVVPEDRSGGSV